MSKREEGISIIGQHAAGIDGSVGFQTNSTALAKFRLQSYQSAYRMSGEANSHSPIAGFIGKHGYMPSSIECTSRV